MNKVYKIIWSKTRDCYVVVSELAKRNAKGSGVRSCRMKATRALSALLVSSVLVGGFSVPTAWAANPHLPENAEYVYGTGITFDAEKNATAWGSTTKASGTNATAWGSGSIAVGDNATAFGVDSKAYGNNSLAALGGITGVELTGTVTEAGATGAVAIGAGAVAYGDNSLAAFGGITGTAATGAVAIGAGARANAKDSLAALGGITGADAIGSVAIGSGANATLSYSIALGKDSVANRAAGENGYRPNNAENVAASAAAWKSTENAVSVGASSNENNTATVTRQITGVAAGTYDTDAVNVAQLKAAEMHYVSIKSDISGDESNYNNKGATGADSIAIGPEAAASTGSAIAIGKGAKASTPSNTPSNPGDDDPIEGQTIAIGKDAEASGWHSIAIGSLTKAGAKETSGSTDPEPGGGSGPAVDTEPAQYAIAIGNNATASGDYGIAFGNTAETSKMYGIAYGNNVVVSGNHGIAIGNNATASGDNGIALGNNAEVKGGSSLVFGNNAAADRDNSIVIGNDAKAGGDPTNPLSGGAYAIAIGNKSFAGQDYGLAVGNNANAGTDYKHGTALGSNSKVNVESGVALGANSVTGRQLGVPGYDPATGGQYDVDAAKAAVAAAEAAEDPSGIANAYKVLRTWESSAGAVSVGNQEDADTDSAQKITRQITDVAAGWRDTDAVNVAQLKAAIATGGSGGKVHFYSVNSTDSAAGNYNGDGATGANALAAGVNAKAIGESAIAIGSGAKANGLYAIAIGDGAKAKEMYSVAIGADATAKGAGSIALGSAGATAAGGASMAWGWDTKAKGTVSTAFGHETVAKGDYSTAWGEGTRAKGDYSTAWGEGTRAKGEGSTAFGLGTVANGDSATAWGQGAKAKGEGSTAFGLATVAKGDYATAWGTETKATGDQATAFGLESVASGVNATAFGESSTAAGDNSLAALGGTTGEAAEGSVAIGEGASAEKSYTYAIGKNAMAVAKNTVAIGNNASATVAGGVALGRGSVADTAKDVAGFDPLTGTASTETDVAWKSTAAAVSVGGNGLTRQITNVAAGAEPTDAVNVAQLKKAATHYYSVNSEDQAEGSNFLNDGATGADAVAAGVGAVASGNSAAAFGDYAEAIALRTIAIGNSAGAEENYGIAIGGLAKAKAEGGIALGTSAEVTGANATAIGNSSRAEAATSVALGQAADAKGESAVAIGTSSEAAKATALAVGHMAKADGESSIALGTTAEAATTAIAMGHMAKAKEESAIALGTNATAAKTGISIGHGAKATGESGVAIGTNSSAANTGVALGHGSSAIGGGVALGVNSKATVGSSVTGYDPATQTSSTKSDAIWKSTLAALSVGGDGQTRQITNVAAGAEPTDAVNVAQLKTARAELQDGVNTTMTTEKDATDGHTVYKVNAYKSMVKAADGETNVTVAPTVADEGFTATYNVSVKDMHVKEGMANYGTDGKAAEGTITLTHEDGTPVTIEGLKNTYTTVTKDAVNKTVTFSRNDGVPDTVISLGDLGATDYRLVPKADGSNYKADSDGVVTLQVKDAMDANAAAVDVKIGDVASKLQQDTNTQNIATNRADLDAGWDAKVGNNTINVNPSHNDLTFAAADEHVTVTADGRTVKVGVTGLADTELSNISDAGKAVVTNIARDAITVEGGGGIDVAQSADKSTYTVKANLSDNLTLREGNIDLANVVKIGNGTDVHTVTVDGAVGEVTGLTNTTLTGADFAKKGRAATEEQLKLVSTEAAKHATVVAGNANVTVDTDTNASGGVEYKVSSIRVESGASDYSTVNSTNNKGKLTFTDTAGDVFEMEVQNTYTTVTKDAVNKTVTFSRNDGVPDTVISLGDLGATDYRLVPKADGSNYKADSDGVVTLQVKDAMDANAAAVDVKIGDVASKLQQDTNTQNIATNRADLDAGWDAKVGNNTINVNPSHNDLTFAAADEHVTVTADGRTVKVGVTGLADTELSNISDAGKAVVTNIARDAITVEGGGGIDVAQSADKSTYTVKANLSDNLTLREGNIDLANVVKIGNGTDVHTVTVDGTVGEVTGLTNTNWSKNEVYNAGRAATEEQLKDLYEAAKGDAISNVKLKFQGETGNAIERGNNEILQVVGDGSNITTQSEYDKIKVELAKNLKVDSVTAGSTVISNDGVTAAKVTVGDTVIEDGQINVGNTVIEENKITMGDTFITNKSVTTQSVTADEVTTGDTTMNSDGLTIAGGPSVTKDGISGGGKKITGVAAGTEGTDAVNLEQLNAATAGSRTEVKDGTNIASVERRMAADGHAIYTVNADGASVSAGSDALTVTESAKDVNNVTDYKVDLSEATRATLDKVENEGLTFAGDTGTGNKIKLGDTLNIKGGAAGNLSAENIGVEGDGDTLNVKLAKDINDVDTLQVNKSVKVGNTTIEDNRIAVGGTVIANDAVTTKSVTADEVVAGDTVINTSGVTADKFTAGDTAISGDGLTVAGGPSVTKKGVDAGGQKVTNVAPGDEDTDAANMGQLRELAENAGTVINNVSNEVNRLDDRMRKGLAGAAALAALHPIEMDSKFGMGLGYGNYRSANAMAMGLFYRPQDNLMFSIGGSMGNGENMMNAGITIALDKGFNTSKALMAKRLQTQGEVLEEQRKANAEQEAKIQALETENAAIKEQNERLEARLAAIEAKLGK